MSKLDESSLQIFGGDCAKALAKVGYYLKSQQGSHMILRRDDP
jgi:predicted RNA binding protein YcfA (HicA-like mRNA interferase family)